jgi:hypothetical protein
LELVDDLGAGAVRRLDGCGECSRTLSNGSVAQVIQNRIE